MISKEKPTISVIHLMDMNLDSLLLLSKNIEASWSTF